MRQLDGRVALVTGGGRGMGRGVSELLAAEGATVAVNYRRDADAARQTVEAIEAAGGVARAYQASVDDPEQDARMVDAVVADLGGIDILVNNGGIASRCDRGAARRSRRAEVQPAIEHGALPAHGERRAVGRHAAPEQQEEVRRAALYGDVARPVAAADAEQPVVGAQRPAPRRAGVGGDELHRAADVDAVSAAEDERRPHLDAARRCRRPRSAGSSGAGGPTARCASHRCMAVSWA